MPTRGHVDRGARLHRIAPKVSKAIIEQVVDAVARWEAAACDAEVGPDTPALAAARLATIRAEFVG